MIFQLAGEEWQWGEWRWECGGNEIPIRIAKGPRTGWNFQESPGGWHVRSRHFTGGGGGNTAAGCWAQVVRAVKGLAIFHLFPSPPPAALWGVSVPISQKTNWGSETLRYFPSHVTSQWKAGAGTRVAWLLIRFGLFVWFPTSLICYRVFGGGEGGGRCDGNDCCCRAGVYVRQRQREGPKETLRAESELTSTNKKAGQPRWVSVGPSQTVQKIKRRRLGRPNTIPVPSGLLMGNVKGRGMWDSYSFAVV